MTHGAGGISYGSGGGGGGFSSGGYMTTYYHGHRRRQDNSGDDDHCCCFLCYIVFFLLCLVKMKPRTRIILTWLYCIVGASVTGGLIGRHYSSKDFSASPTDMRKVEGISAIFCESVLIDSSSLITTYKFESEPKIDENSIVKYNDMVSTSLKRDSYEYWGFFLLKGSVANVFVCPDNGISLYIIKGKKNLDAWIEDSLCSDCYEREYFLYYCAGPSNRVSFTFTASSTDQYYFMFANEGYSIIGPGPANVDIDFKLDRKVYDLDGSTTVCSDEFDCDVPLSIHGTDSVVFSVPRERSLDVSITLICRPRVYMYIIMFAMLPVSCGTIVTVFVLWLAKRNKRQRSASESQVFATPTSEQLHGYTNDSYNINTSPPSYAEAPPSYEDVISGRPN